MYDTEEKKIKEARPEKSCWTWVKQRKRGLVSLTTMKLNQLCAKKSHYLTHAQTLSPRVASIV